MSEFDVDDHCLRLWAQLVGVAPLRLAAALNDAENLHKHLTMEELRSVADTAARLAALQTRMAAALEHFITVKGLRR